jgi:hypothetical protein
LWKNKLKWERRGEERRGEERRGEERRGEESLIIQGVKKIPI